MSRGVQLVLEQVLALVLEHVLTVVPEQLICRQQSRRAMVHGGLGTGRQIIHQPQALLMLMLGGGVQGKHGGRPVLLLLLLLLQGGDGDRDGPLVDGNTLPRGALL